MNITQHGEFLFQLTRYPNFFPVNCYLVREADGVTLIDAGLPGSSDDILKAAESIGLPLTRIVLTHAHGDHVGSLDALHAALPSVEVAISTRDARLLAGDMSLDASEPQTKIRGGFQKVTTVPTRLLEAGDRVGSLEVIATPGHTPGHIAFIDSRDNTLIAGDAWQTVGGLAVSGTFKLVFPWPAMATWHKGMAIQSAQRMVDLNPSRLCIGHGPVLENPVEQMKAAIQLASRHSNGGTHNAV